MRILILFIILVLSFTTAFGQSEAPQTKVIIIGTIHTGNKLFNHKTLYNILKKNKPDLILWEQSYKFKRIIGLRTGKFLNILKVGIEQLSLQKFSRLNKNIEILPYDTTFANKKKYIKKLVSISQTFYNGLNNAKKSNTDSIVYNDFADKYNFYYSFIDTSTLKRINNNDVVDKGRELDFLEEKVIIPLGIKYISDSLIVNKFRNEGQFWKDRNDYMVSQIIKYSKQFEGKRIIILSGLNHKYYLQDKLKDSNKSNVKLVEFVDE